MTLTVGALSLGTTARVMAGSGPSAPWSLGMGFVIVALLLLTRAGEGAAYFPELFVPFALMGLGMGTAMLPLLTIAMSGVPRPMRGSGRASSTSRCSSRARSASPSSARWRRSARAP